MTLNNGGGRIVYRFHVRDLHLVMAHARRTASVPFRVRIDGRPPGAAHGVDAGENGIGRVNEARMYRLIRQPAAIVDRRFEIELQDPGVQVFALTFG